MLDGLQGDWEPIRWTRGPRPIAGPWFWLMSLSLLALLMLALVAFSTMARAQQQAQGTPVLNQVLAARSLSKSDSAKFLPTRAIQIGDAAACTLEVLFFGDTASVTLTNVSPGIPLGYSIIQLRTGTGCGTVYGLY